MRVILASKQRRVQLVAWHGMAWHVRHVAFNITSGTSQLQNADCACQVDVTSDGASVFCPAPVGCIFYSYQPALPLPATVIVTQAGSVFYQSLMVLGTAFFYKAGPCSPLTAQPCAASILAC